MVKRKSGAVLEKLIQLDLLLKSDPNMNRSSLAGALGVSVRSVNRYLGALRSALCVPVARVLRGKGGAASAPIQVGPTDSQGVRSLHAKTLTQPEDYLRPLLGHVHDGLLQRRKLLLRAPELRVDAFVFHPFFLSRVAGEVRLFGLMAGPGQLAEIPVGALAEARCLPEPFEDALAAEPKIRHGRGWIASGTRHEVCLRFPSACRWVMEMTICTGQTIEVSEECFLVHFSTDDLGEVQRFIGALGPLVAIEKPGVLRSRLRKYLTEAYSNYSPLPQDLDRAPSS